MLFALTTSKATRGFVYERREIGDRWLKLQSLENLLPSWIGEDMLKFCFDDCSLLFKRERCKVFLLDQKPADTFSRQPRVFINYKTLNRRDFNFPCLRKSL